MAYSVLIVDDELLMRLELKEMLLQDEDCYVCGEAGNGQEAIALINTLRPSIVLLDLSMPVMNGLELLKQRNSFHCSPRFLVLSCHDEFHMVRETLLNGAHDYLLKNSLDFRTLKEAIDRQTAALPESDLPPRESGSAGSDDFYRQNCLRRLISGGSAPSDMQEYFPMIRENTVCMMFRILRYESVCARYPDRNTEFMIHSLFSIFADAVKNAPMFGLYELDNNLFSLFVSFPELHSAQELRGSQEKLVQRLTGLARMYLNIDLVFGAGRPFSTASSLTVACLQAKKALDHSFYSGKSPVFYENEFSSDLTDDTLIDISQRAVSYCITRDYTKLRDYLEAISRSVHETDALNLPESRSIRTLYLNIYKLIAAAEQFDIAAGVNRLALCETYDELHRAFLSEVYDVHQLSRVSDSDHVTKDILHYIEQHYREDISISQIADTLKLSENYISRTFNSSMGTSIPNYINGFRIEKAKGFLRNANMKIYEIADACGYNSVSYFNIAFKKITGLSPQQYRNENR